MVGIVIVSHSDALAEGVVRLAREMAGDEVALVAAGGFAEDPAALGTDAERVRAAVVSAMSPDGVLVMMDLGSALMSAEFAIELLEEPPGPVLLSDAPLVEGAVAAAVTAAGGASLADVAAEARGALAMKVAQLGAGEPSAPASSAPGSSAVPSASSEPEASAAPAAAAGGATVPDENAVSAVLAVANAIGLHARPAARFVSTVRGFDAVVYVAKAPDGPPVRATSLTNVVALGARRGDHLQVTAIGPQAGEAIAALTELAGEGFGDGVDAVTGTPSRSGAGAGPGSGSGSGSCAQGSPPRPAPTSASPASASPASASPASASPAAAEPPATGDLLRGVPASRGLVLAPAHRLGGAGPLAEPASRPPDAPGQEQARLDAALAGARGAIERDRATLAARAGAQEAEIMDAHLELLGDEALLEPATAAIAAGAGAERAWYDAVLAVAERYRSFDEPLLRERAVDVLDVGRRVQRALTGAPGEDRSDVAGVVVAGELTPADAAGLDPARVLGIATAHGTATAHAAILARALGLPAVVGLGAPVLAITDGTMVLLDGEAGTLLVDPPPELAAEVRARQARAAERQRIARERAHETGATRDGTRIEVFANLGKVAQAAEAVALGAEGVGLLRTEFLFLDRPELPGEEEQAETLRAIARALDGRPLIVRTLDAGADKPLRALPMPAEANPFLGVRGLRLGLVRPDVLETQFRAILRVAAEFPLRAMLPMVATAEEIEQARAVLQRARAATGIDAPLELGIMVEIPAAALRAGQLAGHADFFSIGTNDLTQYTMAAERGNERLAGLLTGPQPAVLALIAATVRGAAARGRAVGVCGELAGDPAAALLLVGLGVTELSMSPALVPEVKAAIRDIDLAAARAVAEQALQAQDATAAHALAAALL